LDLASPHFVTALLASIVESSDDAIISKDLNGIVTSWNRAAERLFGYTAEEMIGKPIAVIAAPDRLDEMPAIIRRLRAGERIDHYETRRRRKDGKILHISLTVSPIRDQTGTIVGASKIARDISQQVEMRSRLELLRREVDHRAKNILQVVQALLRLTRADSLQDYITRLEGRIRALAAAHTQVAESRWRGADLARLLTDTLSPFRTEESRILIDGPSVFIGADAAQALSITVHELATNASKYGALSGRAGKVTIAWTYEEGEVRLIWTESGGPPVSAPRGHGYGMRVIQNVVPGQAEGTVDVSWPAKGLRCSIRFPAPQYAELDLDPPQFQLL
jgi:PAS domain S-box-containing protein